MSKSRLTSIKVVNYGDGTERYLRLFFDDKAFQADFPIGIRADEVAAKLVDLARLIFEQSRESNSDD